MSEKNSKTILGNLFTKVVSFFKDIADDSYIEDKNEEKFYPQNNDISLLYDAPEFNLITESKTTPSVDSSKIIKKKVNPILKIMNYITNAKFNDSVSEPKYSSSAFRLIDSTSSNGLFPKKIISYKDFIQNENNILKPLPVKCSIHEFNKKRITTSQMEVELKSNPKRRKIDEVSVNKSKDSNYDMKSYKSKSLMDIQSDIEEKKKMNKKMLDEISDKISKHSKSIIFNDNSYYYDNKRIAENYFREKKRARLDGIEEFKKTPKIDLKTSSLNFSIQSEKKENKNENITLTPIQENSINKNYKETQKITFGYDKISSINTQPNPSYNQKLNFNGVLLGILDNEKKDVNNNLNDLTNKQPSIFGFKSLEKPKDIDKKESFIEIAESNNVTLETNKINDKPSEPEKIDTNFGFKVLNLENQYSQREIKKSLFELNSKIDEKDKSQYISDNLNNIASNTEKKEPNSGLFSNIASNIEKKETNSGLFSNVTSNTEKKETVLNVSLNMNKNDYEKFDGNQTQNKISNNQLIGFNLFSSSNVPTDKNEKINIFNKSEENQNTIIKKKEDEYKPEFKLDESKVVKDNNTTGIFSDNSFINKEQIHTSKGNNFLTKPTEMEISNKKNDLNLFKQLESQIKKNEVNKALPSLFPILNDSNKDFKDSNITNSCVNDSNPFLNITKVSHIKNIFGSSSNTSNKDNEKDKSLSSKII